MKLVTFVLFFLVTTNSFSECHQEFTYNVNQDDLSVDVAYQEDITFAWETDVLNEELVSLEILEEANGFECDVAGVEHKGEGCYHFTLAWSPGADSSWCKVLMQVGESFKEAKLFMSY